MGEREGERGAVGDLRCHLRASRIECSATLYPPQHCTHLCSPPTPLSTHPAHLRKATPRLNCTALLMASTLFSCMLSRMRDQSTPALAMSSRCTSRVLLSLFCEGSGMHDVSYQCLL